MPARLAAVAALVVAAVAAVVIAGAGILDSSGPSPRVPSGGPAPGPAPTGAPRPKWRLPAAPADVRGAAARRMAIPILMYHVVSQAPAGTPNAELWVAQDRFTAEMRALRRAGYWAITLRQAFDAWRSGGPLPRRPVVVSFDDGYLSQYTHARPALKRLGWPGVLNLKLRNLGPGGITEHQVRALIADGWEVDSHTLTHPDLTTVDDARLRQELAGSRREIRRKFGSARPSSSAIPRASTTPAWSRPCGPRAIAGRRRSTRGLGVRGEPFTLKRVRVNASDTAATLLSRLRDAA